MANMLPIPSYVMARRMAEALHRQQEWEIEHARDSLFCIGGPAHGRYVPMVRHHTSIAIPNPPTRSLLRPFDPDDPIRAIDYMATLYRKRFWEVHPEHGFKTFRYLAPADWTDDQAVDFFTGGLYGTARKANPPAYRDPAAQPDPRDAGRAVRTTTIATYYDPTRDETYTHTVEDAGTRAGEIIGFRAWWLDGARLRSLMRSDIWRAEKPNMTGKIRDHGVYAFKHPLAALAYAMEGLRAFRSQSYDVAPVAVVGAVDLYGEVIEHELGYRAEAASVVALHHAVDGMGRRTDLAELLMRAARDLYGLPPVP